MKAHHSWEFAALDLRALRAMSLIRGSMSCDSKTPFSSLASELSRTCFIWFTTASEKRKFSKLLSHSYFHNDIPKCLSLLGLFEHSVNLRFLEFSGTWIWPWQIEASKGFWKSASWQPPKSVIRGYPESTSNYFLSIWTSAYSIISPVIITFLSFFTKLLLISYINNV